MNFFGSAPLKPYHDAFDLSIDGSNEAQPICAEMQRSLDKLQQCDHRVLRDDTMRGRRRVFVALVLSQCTADVVGVRRRSPLSVPLSSKAYALQLRGGAAGAAAPSTTSTTPKKRQRHSKHEALQLRGGTAATATSATSATPAT